MCDTETEYINDLEPRIKTGIFILGILTGFVLSSFSYLLYEEYIRPKVIELHKNTMNNTKTDTTAAFKQQ
jgi:hypothetical protein